MLPKFQARWNDVYFARTIVEYMILTIVDGINDNNNKLKQFSKKQKKIKKCTGHGWY